MGRLFIREVNLQDIKNAVAVITGGSGGIGKAMAQYWVARGGKVVLADVEKNTLEQARGEIDGDVITVECNVTSESENAKLADFAMDTFGSINLVAPFAGIIKDGLMLSPDRETGQVTKKMALEDFTKVVDINLTGVFLTVRECVERMINNRCRGMVCLVSSTGSIGTAGQINYASTKAAMSVFPKVLTAEFFRRGLSARIRCNAVAPGYVGTPMVKGMNQKALDAILSNVPIGRLIEPEEVASLVGELYRNEALSGETFFIHGGLRIGSKG